MSRQGIFWLFTCAVAVLAANVALRAAMDRTGVKLFSSGIAGIAGEVLGLVQEPRFIAAIAAYGIAMLIWFRLIATEPLSVAYPALAAVTFVAVSLAGVAVFQEPLPLAKFFGILLIISGVFLVSQH